MHVHGCIYHNRYRNLDTCMHIHTYIHICIYAHYDAYVYTRTYIHAHTHIMAYTCNTCIYVHTCICTHTYNIHIWYVYARICMYVVRMLLFATIFLAGQMKGQPASRGNLTSAISSQKGIQTKTSSFDVLRSRIPANLGAVTPTTSPV